MNKLINQLIKDGYLKTDAIIEAFSEINRVEFIPKEFELQADANIALPIGHGRIIPQPLRIAFVLEILEPKKGQKILAVGSGSGWTTALLSYIVGKSGKVCALERKEELMEIGKNNADKYGFVKDGIAEFRLDDGVEEFSEQAPFDCILFFTSVEKNPERLKKFLKVGGRMVMVEGEKIYFSEKKSENEFFEKEFSGFSFAPLAEINFFRSTSPA